MTEDLSLPAAIPQVELGAAGGPVPILVAFSGPVGQRRLTAALRLILAIPHFIVVSVLGVAAEFVAVIGWFGALFTGRLPQFAADYLSGVLRWQVRLNAYVLLLTDVYPPFSLEDSDYPVRVAVPQPGRLNRLAVLFRIVLAIPAALVGGILTFGAQALVPFIAWLIVLFTGTMPPALYQAYAAVTRYTARYTGYLLMLTSAYPAGLFGDQPSPEEMTAGYLTAGPADAGTGAAQLAPWRLVLSGGARKLVGLFLVLGVLASGLYVVLIVVVVAVVGRAANNVVIRNQAIVAVQAADAKLNQALNTSQTRVTACGSNLSCVTDVDTFASRAFDTFAATVRSTPMPLAPAAAEASGVATAATAAGQFFARLGSATSVAQYQADVSSTNVQQLLTQINTDYQNLGRALRPA